MSDVGMFGNVLEHHALEFLAVQWDGTTENAYKILDELQRELRMRGGTVVKSNLHTDTRQSGGPEWLLKIERDADGERSFLTARPKGWIVVHLHRDRFYDAEVLSEGRGEWMFRRLTPVVVLGRGRVAALPEGG
jgi:hypothetical protein